MKKTAIITGGAGYIGSSIARRFAAGGIQVIIFDCNQEQISKVASENGIIGRVVDVTDYEAVSQTVEEVREKYGTIDFLINVAGGSARSEIRPFAIQQMEIIHQVIDINLYGTLHDDELSLRFGGRFDVDGNNHSYRYGCSLFLE